jgi:ABC-2 type transport system permease protein
MTASGGATTDRRPDAQVRASGPGGSIYDLGYQGYEGPRLGREAAIRALFWHTVRSCYGIGRGGRAKIAPFTLAALAVLPAVVGVGISAVALQMAGQSGEVVDVLEGNSPIRYATYHGLVSTLVMLFCAAQAPELLGRDQRFGVLPVYFSRALARLDYAVAKVLGLVVSLWGMVIVPYAVLFIGRVLVAPDPIEGLSDELPSLAPLLAQSLLTSGLLGAIAMAISAFTPRRAYATVGIIAAFLIPSIVVALVSRTLSGSVEDWIVVLSPVDVLDGSNASLFDVRPDSQAVAAANLDAIAYYGAALAGIAVAGGVTIRRYLRIAA